MTNKRKKACLERQRMGVSSRRRVGYLIGFNSDIPPTLEKEEEEEDSKLRQYFAVAVPLRDLNHLNNLLMFKCSSIDH